MCCKFIFDNLQDEYDNIINRLKLIKKNRYKYKIHLLIYKKKLYENKVRLLKMDEDKILNNLILNKYIAKNNKDIIEKTYKSDLFWGISIDIKNNNIIMCWNHALADGYRCNLIVQKILFGTNNKIKNTQLINSNFLLSSYSFLKLFFNIKFFLKLNNKNNRLKIDMDNITFNTKFNFYDINKKIKKGSNFNSTLQKIIIDMIIPESLKNKEFLYGVIFATELYKSFNGLGIVPYFLKKNVDCGDILINEKLKKNFYLGINSINNIIIQKINFKPNFDIIFSGIKFTNNNKCFMNSNLTNFYTYMPYHKSPVYIFTNKCDKNIFVSIGIKNRLIFNHIKNKYNWNCIDE